MKKNNLTLGVCAALLLSSTLAIAESDYPAADFQPKVIFQDSDTQSSAAESKVETAASKADVVDSNYPAADFQPKVIYQDEKVDNSKSSATASKTTVTESAASSETATVDSAYPAANFQPKVLYNDSDYKPSAASATQNKSVAVDAKTMQEASTKAEIAGAETKSGESADSSLIGVVVIALIGAFVLFRKKATTVSASVSKTDNSITGVAKYLQARDKNAVSGVAKYLAKQAEAAAAAKITKVEAYLRNRG